MPFSLTEDAWRQGNVGRQLTNALHRFEARVIALMAEAGQTELGLHHVNMTRHLDLSGTRLTDLAQRAGMTKQSMSELVRQAETLGLVERRDDPSDRRARLICFSARGRAWLAAFRDALETAEREVEEELGSRRYNELKRTLAIYGAGATTEEAIGLL